MTSEKYLSQKKTVNQTFSTSPALKDWLKRSVKVKHKEIPEDAKFRSVSAFINHFLKLALTELSNS